MSTKEEIIDVEIRCTDAVARIIADYGHKTFGTRAAKLDTMVGLTIVALIQEKIDDFEKVNAYLSTNAKCSDRKKLVNITSIDVGVYVAQNKTGEMWKVVDKYTRQDALTRRWYYTLKKIGANKVIVRRYDHFKKTFSLWNSESSAQNAKRMLS